MTRSWIRREKGGLFRCYLCGEYKPFEEFYTDKHKPQGMRSYCRDCAAAIRSTESYKQYQKDYYQQHKERHRVVARETQRARKQRAKENRDD